MIRVMLDASKIMLKRTRKRTRGGTGPSVRLPGIHKCPRALTCRWQRARLASGRRLPIQRESRPRRRLGAGGRSRGRQGDASAGRALSQAAPNVRLEGTLLLKKKPPQDTKPGCDRTLGTLLSSAHAYPVRRARPRLFPTPLRVWPLPWRGGGPFT